MASALVIAGAVAVVVVVGLAILNIWRNSDTTSGGESYQLALEAWLDGDPDEAQRLLTAVVHDDPGAVDPYLQLGNLLRQRGDAARAAVLHRGLTVRTDLTRDKKIAVGLALAADLVSLSRWDEASEVLDGLVRHASGHAAYWRARFAQWYGLKNLPEAARALKAAQRRVPTARRSEFEDAYASFQLDRALLHARAGETGPARDRLRDVRKIAGARSRAALVRAVLATAADGASDDPAGALTVVSDELFDYPHELAVFLPQLQDLLLRSGQFARTVSILERACQSEQAPPELWISLALLYEKLDQRDMALRLLESKAGSEGLTPDVAAPYLRLLARDANGTDLAQIWGLLKMPTASRHWTCSGCGHIESQIRWFCPVCRSFDSFGNRYAAPGEA